MNWEVGGYTLSIVCYVSGICFRHEIYIDEKCLPTLQELSYLMSGDICVVLAHSSGRPMCQLRLLVKSKKNWFLKTEAKS